MIHSMCSVDPNNLESMDIKANLYEHSHRCGLVSNAFCGPAMAQGKAHVSDAWTYAKKEHCSSLSDCG